MGRTALAIALAICVLTMPVLLPSAMASEEGQLSVNITSPSNDAYVGSNLTATWNCTDEVIYYEVQLHRLDGHGTLIKSINVGLNQSIELTDLTDGLHVITVRAHGPDNTWGDASAVFHVDTAPPELDLLYPHENDILNTSNVTARWRAADSSGIVYYEVWLDGQENAVQRLKGSDTQLTFYNLSNEVHSIMVKAVDGSGKSTSRTVQFSVDTTVPCLEIISPSSGFHSLDGSIEVKWNASDAGDNIKGFTIFLNGKEQTNVASWADTHIFSCLKDGEYEVMVRAIDWANNSAQDIIIFTVDTLYPEILDRSPQDGASISTSVSVEFSRPMDPQASSIVVEGVNGTTRWDGLTLIFTPERPLTYGTTYAVKVVAKDDLGRWANDAWTFTTTDMAFLTGTVLDSHDAPLSNVTVAIVGGKSVLTDETGSFRLELSAGPNILSISRSGYVTQNIPITVGPGEEKSMDEIRMSSTGLIPFMGWIVALIALGLVLVLYLVGRHRGQQPPSRRAPGRHTARSWKRLEELERRSR